MRGKSNTRGERIEKKSARSCQGAKAFSRKQRENIRPKTAKSSSPDKGTKEREHKKRSRVEHVRKILNLREEKAVDADSSLSQKKTKVKKQSPPN